MANYHVWSGGDGTTGLSWATAFTSPASIASMVAAANIYIAAETFTVAAEIVMPNGVPVVGGLEGISVNSPDGSKLTPSGLTKIISTDTDTSHGVIKTSTTTAESFYNIIFVNAAGCGVYCNGSMVTGTLYFTNCIFYNMPASSAVVSIVSDRGSISYINCTFYNCLNLSRGWLNTLTVKNCILSGITTKATGAITVESHTYSCYYNGFTMPTGTGNIAADPQFLNLTAYNFRLGTGSPCISTGDPSSTCTSGAYGELGRISMGAYGNTPGATLPAWARGVGYGYNYGTLYGGYVENEYMGFTPHVSESYWAIKINGVTVCYANMLGTDRDTCFTNTAPTGGTAATSLGLKHDATNHRLLFQKDDVTICYLAPDGAHYGAP